MSIAFLAPFARRQHGLVTKPQVLSVATAAQLKRWLRDRHLEPVRRGVYRLAGVPETWHQHLLAACLAAGPATHASFRAAAALHQLNGFGRDILEITTLGIRAAAIDGVIAHETHVFGPQHVATLAGIPTMSVARTLCDLTALAPPAVIEANLDDALRRKLLSLRSLAQVAADLEGQGRRSCTVMRKLLDARKPGYHPGDSEPERRIANLLVRAGLPRPTPQYRIRLGSRTVRADLAYPDLMLVIEFDGWEFHRQRSSFDRDAKRRNSMKIAGYTVLVFTSAARNQEIVETVVAARERAVAS